jgi:hypothetical protein
MYEVSGKMVCNKLHMVGPDCGLWTLCMIYYLCFPYIHSELLQFFKNINSVVGIGHNFSVSGLRLELVLDLGGGELGNALTRSVTAPRTQIDFFLTE